MTKHVKLYLQSDARLGVGGAPEHLYRV